MEGGTLDLAVPPFPFIPGVPPLPDRAVTSSTLATSFPLVTFDVCLGSVVFVPVPLPVVDILQAFMVGMEVLLSKHCL